MTIYVTGLGVVSAIGCGVEENIDALRHYRHGLGKVSLFETSLDVPVGEVKLDNETLAETLSLNRHFPYSRTFLLGLLAAREACRDAGIETGMKRTGFISGTSVGGMDRSEVFYESFRNDPEQGDIRLTASHDCADSTLRIAQLLGITGLTTTISTACSSAANAILLGARLINSGRLDTVIAGGTDALCRFTLNGFNSLKILDKELCRPYDNSRAGLNLGEGAGYIVLQNEKAMRRQPYCRLTGYANTNDAFHQTGSSPEGNGAFRAMNEAITMAGIPPDEVSYINVHGTGTPLNDLSESRAMLRLFKNHVPPFASVKGYIGHALGGSEGIEAVYSALCVARGIVLPNLRFTTPIEETMLTPVVRYSEGNPIRHVLSNAFGFGGNETSLLFSQP